MANSSHGGPAVIVFSDSAFGPVLANWIEHARAARVSNIVVIALDRAISEAMTARNIASVALPPAASRGQLLTRRVELFAGLAKAGIDFIHSDADAIWLGSPVEAMQALDTDLVFSPGTIWPLDVAKAWGFVLCCGLFFARANPATAGFFAAALERAKLEQNDQIALNRVLKAKGIVWQDAGRSMAKVWRGRSFRIFERPITGTCHDLRVGLLPHRLFPRLPEISADTVVAHPLSPKSADGTIEELRRLGLWCLG